MTYASAIMSLLVALLENIQASPDGETITGLLKKHPGLARRTLQRRLGQLMAQGRVAAAGEGRYLSVAKRAVTKEFLTKER